MKRYTGSFKGCLNIRIWIVPVMLVCIASTAWTFPLIFKDDRGKEIHIAKKPERIVCLVPSLTEVIFEIGAGDSVKGVTLYDLYPPQAALKPAVGGFFSPSTEKIRSLSPDLLIVADLHHEKISEWEKICPVVQWNIGSVKKAYEIMAVLGEICGRKNDALLLVEKNRKEMDRIARKVETIPLSKRKQMVRFMGKDEMMTPSDDSFQNELIRTAGGIPPQTGKKTFDKPWDLTFRSLSRMGYFVSSIAADLYPERFMGDGPGNEKQRVIGKKKLIVALPYINDISVKQSVIFDFIHKSLVIEFKNPLDVTSTLDGFRKGIKTVGNHYFPPQTWMMGHEEGLPGLKRRTFKVLSLNGETTSFLFTGADMDHLVIKEKEFKNMKVFALVTAGVRGNALKTSKDKGNYIEPGTINIVILTNRRLSQAAMGRAVITATEAKTAALLDLDIRSSCSPLFNQATGTGTDNVLVVSGEGPLVENTGGHSKMGELIGLSVYEAVKEAIFFQNGIAKGRQVYHRMMERNITFQSLLQKSTCECGMKKESVQTELEHLILEPRYAAFIEGAFALSDTYENAQIQDLGFFKSLSLSIASEIAGKPITGLLPICNGQGLPSVLEIAFNALIHGAMERVKP